MITFGDHWVIARFEGLFSQILLMLTPQAYWLLWNIFPQGVAQLPICEQPSKEGEPSGWAQIRGYADKSHWQDPKICLQKSVLVQIPPFWLKYLICPSIYFTYSQLALQSLPHLQPAFGLSIRQSQSLSQYCYAITNTIVSIWNLALFPRQGRTNSQVRSPAFWEKIRVSLTLRSRSTPSRVNARMFENQQPAALRQSKVFWTVTRGAVSMPMRERAGTARRIMKRNPCRIFSIMIQ